MGGNQVGGFVPILTDMEKRQLFLRSYQFSRKQSLSERIKKSLFRVKRVIWVRRKFVWFRLKHVWFYSTARRKWFLRLQNNTYRSNWPYSCFW